MEKNALKWSIHQLLISLQVNFKLNLKFKFNLKFNNFSAPAERSEAGAKFDPRPQNPRRDEEKGDEWGQIMGNGGQMLHHCVCGGP